MDSSWAMSGTRNYDKYSAKNQREERNATQSYLETLKATITQETATKESATSQSRGATTVHSSRTTSIQSSRVYGLTQLPEHLVGGTQFDQPHHYKDDGEKELLSKLKRYQATGYMKFEKDSFREFQRAHPVVRRASRSKKDQAKTSTAPTSTPPVQQGAAVSAHQLGERSFGVRQSRSDSPPAQVQPLHSFEGEKGDSGQQLRGTTLPPRPQHPASPRLTYEERGRLRNQEHGGGSSRHQPSTPWSGNNDSYRQLAVDQGISGGSHRDHRGDERHFGRPTNGYGRDERDRDSRNSSPLQQNGRRYRAQQDGGSASRSGPRWERNWHGNDSPIPNHQASQRQGAQDSRDDQRASHHGSSSRDRSRSPQERQQPSRNHRERDGDHRGGYDSYRPSSSIR